MKKWYMHFLVCSHTKSHGPNTLDYVKCEPYKKYLATDDHCKIKQRSLIKVVELVVKPIKVTFAQRKM